jgi:hypothetical protein
LQPKVLPGGYKGLNQNTNTPQKRHSSKNGLVRQPTGLPNDIFNPPFIQTKDRSISFLGRGKNKC